MYLEYDHLFFMHFLMDFSEEVKNLFLTFSEEVKNLGQDYSASFE